MAVLFAGFFPALSEEFLSRAFSIPFFERIFRSRLFAIILAGFVWGFGHSTYPNQPFYIRGLEVGLAGVLIGLLMNGFGLLPLLIWHYTVDAVYTALMLFRSGNTYFVLSGAISSLVFAIPLLASIALYLRNRGFVPDDDLSNAALPVSAPPETHAEAVEVPLPDPIRPSRRLVIACAILVVLAIVFIATRPASPEDVIDYRVSASEAKGIAAAHLRSLGQRVPEKVAALPVSAFRSWDADSPREDGGAPDGFDDTAATYMVRRGMSVRDLTNVMRTKIQAATIMVRFFTPLQKTEYFVEIDPRAKRVAGYHKYADERAAGTRLERDAALAIATQAFARYGTSAAGFDLKEALSYQQPNRRDWLFHFEEKRPLVAQAFRRVTVRVMGSEVTQFASTVKVPEAVYREARQQTLINILLLILRALGAIAALALVVSGFIMATRHGRMLWRRAARVTALLAIIPIARALATRELRLFTYNTAMAWDTFLLNVTTDVVRTAGLQILMLFVAIAAIYSVVPFAPALLSRDGRARFGRHAVIAVLTTIGLLVSGRAALRLIPNAFPAIASVSEISVPDAVVLPAPVLLEIAIAIVGAIVFSGAVSLFATAVSAWKNRSAAAIATMAIVFCIALDSGASREELPMTIGTSLALAALVWVIARWILDANPLAWPLAALVISLIESGATLAQNHRPDLQIQAWIVFAVAGATLIWAAARDYRTTPERFSTTNATGD